MADIRPFRALHYNLVRVSNLADVITPPYDVISPDQKVEYLKRSPVNVVRLILPDGENPYETANQTLQSWIQQEILIREQEPGLYCYNQTYKDSEGVERTRKGFIILIKLEDFEKGIVLPHEATLFAPKEDRLNLLRACKTNFSAIFGLFSDPEQKIDSLLEPFTEAPPRAKVDDDSGITNAIWSITDEAVIKAVQHLMSDKWVLIADGHHRYESCLVYRDEMSKQNPDPEAPFNFTMMFLTNIDHPGISISPYNRGVMHLPEFQSDAVLTKAAQYFEISEFEEQDQAFFALKRKGEEGTAFLAMFTGSRGFYLMKLKPDVKLKSFYPAETPETLQKLDVNVLQKIFFEKILGISDEDVKNQTYIKYYKDSRDEVKDFSAGRLQIAFFLNPTRVEQVVDVAKAGKTMPQKSTFFYPKIMTGFVMNRQE